MLQGTKKIIVGLAMVSLAGLTACSGLPTLSKEDAQSKMDNFLTSVVENTDLAYAETSDRFQENTSLEAFKTIVSNSSLQDYSSFTLTELAYQQGVGLNAAKIDGTISFASGATQEASFIWSYNNSKQDWFLDAFRFE